jgi:hypothetical protein
MGERPDRYWDDLIFDPPEYKLMSELAMASGFIRIQDSFIIGTDPIEPINPKSEGDDLIFKTTPKYVL